MAWSDKPTETQIGALLNLIQWKISSKTEKKAADWLMEHANRKQVSDEMGRVRSLYISHKLNAKNCFESEIWEGFEPEEDDE